MYPVWLEDGKWSSIPGLSPQFFSLCSSLLWAYHAHPSGTKPSFLGRVGWVQFFNDASSLKNQSWMTLVCLQTEVSPSCTNPASLQGCAMSTPLYFHKKVNFFYFCIGSYKKVSIFFNCFLPVNPLMTNIIICYIKQSFSFFGFS